MASFEKIPFFVITGHLCVINFRVKLFAGLLLIKNQYFRVRGPKARFEKKIDL